MSQSYTAQQLADSLGISERAVRKRATNERWCFTEIPNASGGGFCKRFAFDSLPDAVQLAIRRKEAEQLAMQSADDQVDEMIIATHTSRGTAPANGSGKLPASCPIDPATGEGLGKKEQDRALLISRLVSEYRSFYSGKTNGAVVRAKKDFVEAYNAGDIGTFSAIYSLIGKTSFQSIERWDLALRRNSNDPFALADRRGKHRKGTTSVTPEQERIIKSFAFHPNRLPDSEIIRASAARMRYEGIACQQSEDTFRRYLDRLRTNDYPDWIFRREGWKALNEKCLFHVSRDYDEIEVGDIAFADGHVMNFECLNPWTGRPKRMDLIAFYDMKSNYPLGWEIMPSENTEAIKVALYRSILTLGKFPKVPYLDNGRAFRGQFFTGVKRFEETPEVGLFERLGMKPIFAWPYHAETKPIEGFFKIFGELERLSPSYSGSCIENKPARMKRGEFLHRKLYDTLLAGKTPTILDAHQAIAHWIDTEYAIRPQGGHLNGKCPLEVFLAGKGPGLSEEDQVRLRLLMAQKSLKKIPRDGIRMPWSDKLYYHPDLFGRQNQPGIVRHDWQDKSRIYVYDAEGKFICEARQTEKVHPAAAQLGTSEQVAELSRQLEMKAHLAKTVTGRAAEFIREHVAPEVQRQIEETCLDRGPIDIGARRRKELPDIDVSLSSEEAEAANREFEEELAGIHSGTVEATRLLPADAEFAPDRQELLRLAEPDRYETLLEWSARGVEINMDERRWMSMYEKTREYNEYRSYFEDAELRFQLLYATAK